MVVRALGGGTGGVVAEPGEVITVSEGGAASGWRSLAEVSQALAEATQSLEAVLGLVARRAVELLGDGGALFLASDDEAWLQPVAFDHRDPDGALAMGALFAPKPYRVTDDDAISLVFRTGRPALLADLTPAQFEETKPEYGEFFERFPIHGLLAVPLRARGRTIGVLAIA